jgi:hypothetical protein
MFKLLVIGGLSLAFLGAAAMATPLRPAQTHCEAVGDQVDNDCTGCATTITLICNDGAETCEPCTFAYIATVLCPPFYASITTDSGSVECKGKIERRFGGCPGSQVAWGGITCECSECF